MMILGGVPISVVSPPKILPKARGINKRAGGISYSFAATIVIGNINFAFDSDKLSADARAILDANLSHLHNNPKVIGLVLNGHTDSTGPADYNQGLSVRRAQSVANYLSNHGVATSIMQVVGHGESQPIASNATKEGRAENRRVEVDVDIK